MAARDDGILTDATQSPEPSKPEIFAEQPKPPVQTEFDKAITWSVDALESANITVFCDALGELYVRMPNDHQHKVHRFTSSRVGAWLAAQYFKENMKALPDQVLGYVKKILEDEAWQAPSLLPIESRTWELLERSQVAMAIFSDLNTKGDYKGRSVEYYKRVKPPVCLPQQGFTSNKFPVNTQVFIRKMKELIPLFQVIGIEIEVVHKEDGSHCSVQIRDPNLFYREPDGNLVSPSGTPSPPTDRQTKELRKSDVSDAIHNPPRTPQRTAPTASSSHQLGQRRTAMTGRFNERHIESWSYASWDEITGNYKLKIELQQFVRTIHGPNGGQGINHLVLGPSRSGKTSLLELAFQAALCWKLDLLNLIPCGTCEACIRKLGRQGVQGLWTLGWLAPGVKVGYQQIDGNTITALELEKIIMDRSGEREERNFLWIDEIQGLVRRNLDHSLLKAVEQHPSITWVVSTATTKGLEPMFRNRFTEVNTEPPELKDFVEFITKRCLHPKINLPWDNDETIIELALRAKGIPGKAMKCLAKAKMYGKLTRTLVENYPFDLLDSE